MEFEMSCAMRSFGYCGPFVVRFALLIPFRPTVSVSESLVRLLILVVDDDDDVDTDSAEEIKRKGQ